MNLAPSALARILHHGARLLALGALLASPLAHADDYSDVNQLMRQGKHAQALARADQYLAAKPRDPQMRFLKGVIQSDSGKSADATATFVQLTEDYPELPEPYNNLGVLYAGQGLYDKARAALEMAIRTNPSYATAQENLGDVYARLASQAYSKALQLDASNTSVPPKLVLIRQLFTPGTPGARPAPAKTAPKAEPAALKPAAANADPGAAATDSSARTVGKARYSADPLQVSSRMTPERVKSGERWLRVRESTGA
ncbi:hypothetical protein B2J88_21900 [Rhodococcus sp. SRB_17]|nr:hypothetical protein [Rhodococcus sp. SRB_17]